MLNLKVPSFVEGKIDELNKLCEANPVKITVVDAAKFLGVHQDSLRAALECGNCPFGLAWQKEAGTARGFFIPTLTFWLWYTQGAGYRR